MCFPTRIIVIAALCLFLPVSSFAADSAAAAALPPALEAAEKDAAQWLVGQMVPNETVPAPSPGRRRLILSYQVAAQDPAYRYIYGRSFVYDDALAVIALTMLGQYREAEFVLNALARLLQPDGSLWFAYNTQNSWPDESDHDGAIVRSGAVAWVGYAFTYYLAARSRSGPGLAASDALGAEYTRAARAIASYLVARQVTDPADSRYGLITGGLGASTLTMDGGGSAPTERYTPARVEWVSVEHNIDAWFFLRDLARLTTDPGLAASAELLRGRLALLWSSKNGQFIQGIHEDKTADTELPLDGASWGALFLLAAGREDQARRSAAVMHQRFSSSLGEARGFRPYGAAPVYADESVNRFFYPADRGKMWQDLPFIWGEGSFGAAAALVRTGSPGEALGILDSLRSMAVAGGFRYASSPVPYQFTDYPSVASTAWFVIAAEMLRGTSPSAQFWGP